MSRKAGAPSEARRRDKNLCKRAGMLLAAGSTWPEVARELGTSEATARRLFRGLDVPGRLSPSQPHERKDDASMSIPSYQANPFWTPSTRSEAIDLAADLKANNMRPEDYKPAFGETYDLALGSPVEVLDLADLGSVNMAITVGDLVTYQIGGEQKYGQIVRGGGTEAGTAVTSVRPLMESEQAAEPNVLVPDGTAIQMVPTSSLSPATGKRLQETVPPNNTPNPVTPDLSAMSDDEAYSLYLSLTSGEEDPADLSDGGETATVPETVQETDATREIVAQRSRYHDSHDEALERDQADEETKTFLDSWKRFWGGN